MKNRSFVWKSPVYSNRLWVGNDHSDREQTPLPTELLLQCNCIHSGNWTQRSRLMAIMWEPHNIQKLMSISPSRSVYWCSFLIELLVRSVHRTCQPIRTETGLLSGPQTGAAQTFLWDVWHADLQRLPAAGAQRAQVCWTRPLYLASLPLFIQLQLNHWLTMMTPQKQNHCLHAFIFIPSETAV